MRVIMTMITVLVVMLAVMLMGLRILAGCVLTRDREEEKKREAG